MHNNITLVWATIKLKKKQTQPHLHFTKLSLHTFSASSKSPAAKSCAARSFDSGDHHFSTNRPTNTSGLRARNLRPHTVHCVWAPPQQSPQNVCPHCAVIGWLSKPPQMAQPSGSTAGEMGADAVADGGAPLMVSGAAAAAPLGTHVAAPSASSDSLWLRRFDSGGCRGHTECDGDMTADGFAIARRGDRGGWTTDAVKHRVRMANATGANWQTGSWAASSRCAIWASTSRLASMRPHAVSECA